MEYTYLNIENPDLVAISIAVKKSTMENKNIIGSKYIKEENRLTIFFDSEISNADKQILDGIVQSGYTTNTYLYNCSNCNEYYFKYDIADITNCSVCNASISSFTKNPNYLYTDGIWVKVVIDGVDINAKMV